jgi:putative glutamine amidotransferase
MTKPLIGMTSDRRPNASGVAMYESNPSYSRAIIRAGGVPVILPQDPALAESFASLCQGLVFTGGNDAHTQTFGAPMHPQAQPVDPRRQDFELALLAACDRHPELPVLGICFGMQLMALHAGGRLHQHLPDLLGPGAANHSGNHRHPVTIATNDSVLSPPLRPQSAPGETVVSAHHQAVDDPGRLRIVARAADAVIEAVDDPSRRFYLGVQWHPERGEDQPLSLDLVASFVAAAAGRLPATVSTPPE